MKIGIITTWFERGAAYVSRIYMNLLEKEGHEIFIYARGGEDLDSKNDPKWNQSNVTRDNTYCNLSVNRRKMYKWIKDNKLEAIFFNEQQDFKIVAQVKKSFPNIKIGSYIDYYTENTLPWFNMFDFVICNTHRHMQALNSHPQKYYVKWGTDINVYKPTKNNKKPQLTFFHSAGMSKRKGTDLLIDSFIKGECYNKAKLVIHTQRPIETLCNYNREQLENYNIEVIERTVTAPGLYYLGDVYVYPTRLDGLGLTMYEALSCGLPVITTNFPPMNEVINDKVGKLIKVEDFYCRGDAYYFPMALCDKESIINCMNWYIDNYDKIDNLKNEAREFAKKNYNISDRSKEVSNIFENAVIRPIDISIYKDIIKYYGIRNSYFISKLRERKKFVKIIRFLKNKSIVKLFL